MRSTVVLMSMLFIACGKEGPTQHQTSPPFVETVLIQPPIASESNTGREVLTTIYQATGGENRVKSKYWLSEKPLDRWYKVNLNDSGEVTELHLTNNNLTGKIPSGLSQLLSLEFLNLASNDLTGAFPF